jgi:hypothetical protein
MKMEFDIKSLIAGLFIGAVVMLTVAAALKPPGTVGRFQTTLNDNGSLVMTDTTTGQAWSTFFSTPGSMNDQEFKKPKVQ